MSADLDRMFSALRADADRTGLPAPDGLRRRGDQRRRRQAVAGLLAVAVLVGGGSVGARQLLAGPPATPPVPPGTTPSATAPPSPSTELNASPVGSPVAMPPGCDKVEFFPYRGRGSGGMALPGSMMLQASDVGRCYGMRRDDPGYYQPDGGGYPAVLPLCELADYPSNADRVAGRYRLFDGHGKAHASEHLTRYRAGSAEAYLDEFRARAARCATFNQGEGPPWHIEIVEENIAGDESLLIYAGPGSGDKPGSPALWFGLARVGDLVIIVSADIGQGGDRALTKALLGKAVERVR
ncbi:hypothetical protein WEI85_30140 [Actinomycetes bacterium KLBMP 9797]